MLYLGTVSSLLYTRRLVHVRLSHKTSTARLTGTHCCTCSCSEVTRACPPPSAHEVLHKELAAHKEMVSELRKQLVEKEEDFKVGCSCWGARAPEGDFCILIPSLCLRKA